MRVTEARLELLPDEPAAPALVVGAADAAIVRAQVAGVFRFVRCLGAGRELAADLTQEAFVIAWQKGKQRLPQKALAAFLRRSARLLWLEHRRAARREESARSAITLRIWADEVDDDGSELVAAARACVRRLQGRSARAIELAYRDGESREAIAAELGMQPNGCRLHRPRPTARSACGCSAARASMRRSSGASTSVAARPSKRWRSS